MANFHIITNNPLVWEKYAEWSTLCEATVEEMFIRARDRIHRGAVLINHPLSGSVKPNESPYKSLVLSTPRKELDFQSLQLIEGALAVLHKLPQKQRAYTERVLEDFRVIDLDLLDSAMASLPAEYHR